MAKAGSTRVVSSARAAMAAMLAQDKASVPAPNDRDPRRVTAHYGAFRLEAEFPPGRADSQLMIERNGALLLRAQIEPEWKHGKRSDKIDIVDLHGSDWIGELGAQLPGAAKAAKPARGKTAARGKRKPRRRSAGQGRVKVGKRPRARSASRRPRRARKRS